MIERSSTCIDEADWWRQCGSRELLRRCCEVLLDAWKWWSDYILLLFTFNSRIYCWMMGLNGRIAVRHLGVIVTQMTVQCVCRQDQRLDIILAFPAEQRAAWSWCARSSIEFSKRFIHSSDDICGVIGLQLLLLLGVLSWEKDFDTLSYERRHD